MHPEVLQSMRKWILAAVIGLGLGLPASAEVELDFAEMRAELVRYLGLYAQQVSEAEGVPAIDQRVLEVMAKVPRHSFIPEKLLPYAYLDRPLPVGKGQNIAQPYIIALMTSLARIEADDVIYETGTGAGYHAAILAELGGRGVQRRGYRHPGPAGGPGAERARLPQRPAPRSVTAISAGRKRDRSM